MKVLFLDDNQERISTFKAACPAADIVTTAEECISRLSKEKYDIVFLDHDLGGKVFQNSGDEDCGMQVVKYLVASYLAAIPPVEDVVIHTFNPAGAETMVSALQSCHYYTVYRSLFGTDGFWSIVDQASRL